MHVRSSVNVHVHALCHARWLDACVSRTISIVLPIWRADPITSAHDRDMFKYSCPTLVAIYYGGFRRSGAVSFPDAAVGYSVQLATDFIPGAWIID
jgi:hypothetical protein